MAELYRLESPTDPHIGGALVRFPSERALTVAWRHDRAIDAHATAKRAAAELLERLLAQGATDDANRTNWPSLVAALQRIVRDWDQARPAVDNQVANG